MNCDFPLTKATVALGSTNGQFAGLVRELAFPPGKSTSEIKEMYINDLAAAKIDTVPEQVAIGLPHPKDNRGRYAVKFVGQARHDVDAQLQTLLMDPPMSRSILIPIPTHGIILNPNGGPNRAKITVLPFGGAGFKEKLIVRGAILPADYYNSKRLMLVQTKVVFKVPVHGRRARSAKPTRAMPPPPAFGFLGTGRTAPRLPACAPTASELGERASHPMERSATFTRCLPLRPGPCFKVLVHGRRRALCEAHSRYATPIYVRLPRHQPHRTTASRVRADRFRAG